MSEGELHLIYAVFAVVGVAIILFINYYVVPKVRALGKPDSERTVKFLVFSSYVSAGMLALIAYILTVL